MGKVNLITVYGTKNKDTIHTNIGYIKPINWYDYQDLQGYWELWKYEKNVFKIKNVFKK